MQPLDQASPPSPNGVPMAGQIDPLTGLPIEEMRQPDPNYDVQGAPLPWPPDHWQAGDEPGAPMPTEFQGQDVPVVPTEAPAMGKPAIGGMAPEEGSAPVEAAQAGYAAMEGVGDVATQEVAKADQVAEAEAIANQTPDEQYGAYLAKSADEHHRALTLGTEAANNKRDVERVEGMRAAREANRRNAEVEADYRKVQGEAKVKRLALEQEAKDIANQKIDPNRAWNNMSFGAQLFTGIAAVLVGMGRKSMRTGRNGVTEMLDGMAARDIEAQKGDLENRTRALGVRRGLLQDDLDAGKDMLDFEYKATSAAYLMAQNYIKAEVLKYDNDAFTANAMEEHAKIDDSIMKLAYDYNNKRIDTDWQHRQDEINNRVAWYNATTNRNAQLDATQGRKDAAEARKGEVDWAGARETRTAAEEKAKKEIRGNDGRTIGVAKSDKEAEHAFLTLDGKTEMTTLAVEGRKLFKDGWSNPVTPEGAELRARQNTWNKQWGEARRHASGDHSAPNTIDQLTGGSPGSKWQLDPTTMINNNNMEIIDEGMWNALNVGAAKLRRSGVSEDDLIVEGFVKGPPPPPARNITPVAHIENGVVNYEGRGNTATDAEVTKAKENAPNNADGSPRDVQGEKALRDPEWASRQRALFGVQRQANIKAVQGGVRDKKDLPYPKVGTIGDWDKQGHPEME